jgi:hypothetical protein
MKMLLEIIGRRFYCRQQRKKNPKRIAPDNRMILKQISKGNNHYLKKQQPS